MMAIPSIAAQISEMGKAMLVAGLSLLAAAAVLLYSAERDLRANNLEVRRANSALLQLAEIKNLVIGVDYSARGYALTGEQLFLDHEHQKQRALPAGLDKLATLCDPEQAADIARLAELIKRHAAVYAKFVTLGPSRAREMAALITNTTERQKRYDALDVIERLHGALMADLVRHQAAAERQQRHTLMLTFLIVILAFLGGLLDVVVVAVRARRARRIALPAVTE